MRVSLQAPSLEGSRPEADNETRSKVADRSTEPEPKRERLTIAISTR